MHGGIECFYTTPTIKFIRRILFGCVVGQFLFFHHDQHGGDGAICHAGLFFKHLQTQQASAVNDTENNNFGGFNSENGSIMTINDMAVFNT